ncbi:MAG: SAM-dependent methyltransferase [Pirellula sp.]|nr:SAM-dependent methyltransferase [Pirellula sp.]
MTSPQSTERFSDRVADYVRYRPGYPAETLDVLRDAVGLTSESVVADIGSGTGISTELLLRSGAEVYGVEPNDPMRAAAEAQLSANPRFHSVRGTAEATTLADGSVDIVAAAQAFHWFDRDRTRSEFARILRSAGYVVLLWNSRHVDTTPLLRGYEALLQQYATDYNAVNHQNIDAAAVARFYAPGTCTRIVLPNSQSFDFAGLRGRLLSSSYAPAAGDPRHEPMLAALRQLFDDHAAAGASGEKLARFDYDTEIYYGRLDS